MTIRRPPALRIKAVQAEFGDCLLVECPAKDGPRYLLVDGGPAGTYVARLRPILSRLAARGQEVDLAVLSHIDNDHVTGLLEYLRELRDARTGRRRALPPIRQLWHNSFSQAAGGRDVAPLARKILAQSRSAAPMRNVAAIVSGVAEGDALTTLAAELGVPTNSAFAGRHVMTMAAEPSRLGEVMIHVAGPSQPVLDRLREEWLAWHRKHAAAPQGPATAIAADRSVPNLSSIVMLLEWQGRRLLLTGDGRGDQITAGLADAGLMDGGSLHVSMLKLPHHGSSRNVKPDFLRTVTADRYLISANGRYGNPDLQCLQWTVEAARDAGRRIELVFTNEAPSIDELKRACPTAEYGYRIRVLRAGRRSISSTV